MHCTCSASEDCKGCASSSSTDHSEFEAVCREREVWVVERVTLRHTTTYQRLLTSSNTLRLLVLPSPTPPLLLLLLLPPLLLHQ